MFWDCFGGHDGGWSGLGWSVGIYICSAGGEIISVFLGSYSGFDGMPY
jgi:hypothetical protein